MRHFMGHSWYWFIHFHDAFWLAAAAKVSAQFPFSSWLPRALEKVPDIPSSALFSMARYGCIWAVISFCSRLFPFWEIKSGSAFIIGLIGLNTGHTFRHDRTGFRNFCQNPNWIRFITQIGIICLSKLFSLETLVLTFTSQGKCIPSKPIKLLVFSFDLSGFTCIGSSFLLGLNLKAKKSGKKNWSCFPGLIIILLHLGAWKEWNLDLLIWIGDISNRWKNLGHRIGFS